jgi:hypothetical protein
VRKHARHAGGDLLLAAPQQQVLRFLTVHPSDRRFLRPCLRRGGSIQRRPKPARPGSASRTGKSAQATRSNRVSIQNNLSPPSRTAAPSC